LVENQKWQYDTSTLRVRLATKQNSPNTTFYNFSEESDSLDPSSTHRLNVLHNEQNQTDHY